MKKVSVILNSYNRIGPWLYQAIMSVVNQTYQGPIELIIVDDGSANQFEILKMVEPFRKVLEIKVRLMSHCGNLATRRNDGLELATGDYVCLLDDDNAMDSERISRCADHLDTCSECDAVYHLSRYMDPAGNLGDLVNFYRTAEVDLDSIMHKRNHIDSGEVMLRRDVFEKLGIFDERCIILEDWDLWRRVLKFGKMHFIPAMLSYYRSQHPGRRVFSMSVHDQSGMQYIMSKKLVAKLFCDFRMAPLGALTFSQSDVTSHIYQAAAETELLNRENPDVIFCVAPFKLSEQAKEHKNGQIVATIHVEDPYAHGINKHWCSSGVDWVFTNDEACIESYKTIGRKVAVMPSMSAFQFGEPGKQKLYDVVFIGTPYPERIQFFNELYDPLRAAYPDAKVLLAGPPIPGCVGWGTFSGKYQFREDQLDPMEVMRVAESSRIVLVLNRKTGFNPVTPSRGFIETASGSMVLMDRSRREIQRYFQPEKEIALFGTANECALAIATYLKDTDLRESIARAGWERAHEYTYKKRISRALQSIQANREAFL
jgi:glycosyltransferase involved in cell wall biosynthesis